MSILNLNEQELLPGLPDVLVMHFIFPRIPWYKRPCMLVISKAWRFIFENCSFMESRTQELYKPTGLFLIHELSGSPACMSEEQLSKSPSAPLSSQDSDDDESDIFLLRKYAIDMYDMQDRSWHSLPSIKTCPSEIPYGCSFVCTDGRLFVMGGIPDTTKDKESADMYMLNVGLGHWWWEQCASMHFSRAYVKCTTREGCIYVVGGTCPAEFYILNDNQWHQLPEMVDVPFFCNGILALENQIFAYGYDILDPDIPNEPDVISARVYDFISRTWSTIEFDLTKCCTSAFGRMVLNVVDGTLITYDTKTQNSITFYGKLQDQMDIHKGRQISSRFFNKNDYIYHPSCQTYDLVSVEISTKPLQVYTLVSLYGSRLRELWHGTINFSERKVTWDQNILCPFQLCQLDSDNLSELCYMS